MNGTIGTIRLVRTQQFQYGYDKSDYKVVVMSDVALTPHESEVLARMAAAADAALKEKK